MIIASETVKERWHATMGTGGNPLGRLVGTHYVGKYVIELHVDTLGARKSPTGERANITAWSWSPGEDEPESDGLAVPRTQHTATLKRSNGQVVEENAHRPGWWVEERREWFDDHDEARRVFEGLDDHTTALQWMDEEDGGR